MNIVRSFVNCVIFHELCDRMQFEVDCAKSHHHVISEGLIHALQGIELAWCKWAFRVGFETNAIASPSNNVTSRSLQPFAYSGLVPMHLWQLI